MSMVTVSKKRNRIYQRKFDHDLCRAMYSTGKYTIAELCVHFNVSHNAVNEAVNPAFRQKRLEQRRRWSSAHPDRIFLHNNKSSCEGCGKPMWGKGKLCNTCRRSPGIENGLVYCTDCCTWKDAGNFRFDPRRWWRGFLMNQCRQCETSARRERAHKGQICAWPGCENEITVDSRTGHCREHARYAREQTEIFGT